MRLFFALLPPDAMMDALDSLMEGVALARWQTHEQLHLTTRFVGEVDGDTADRLGCGLEALRPVLPPIALAEVGVLGKPRPNALIVHARPCEPLARLHAKLDRLCRSSGLAPEHRTYCPHVTVARLGRHAGPVESWIERHAGFRTRATRFARLALLESIATSAGRRYPVLAEARVRDDPGSSTPTLT